MSTETTGLNLVKGQKVDLTKGNASLKEVNFGLGWDINKGNSGTFDLDAFALLLNTNGKLFDGGTSVIYFNHKSAHGVASMGDNLTGAGDGDDETIKCHLEQIPSGVESVLICVNIYQAKEKHQNFGMVDNAFIRAYDAENPATELMKFDLSEDSSAFTGFVMGKLYRKEGEWKFQAIGEGHNGTIDEISAPYQN